MHRRESEFSYDLAKRFLGQAQFPFRDLDTPELHVAMMRMSELLFEKVFEIGFRQPEPFRATCGGKRAPYRPFPVGEVAVGKGFVLPDKGFVRRIPGDELPLVKAGRIIQQPDDMPGQNRARVAIRTVTEFPAQIVETGGEDATFFAGYVERFCGSIRKKRILFGPFLLYAALEQIGVECNRPQAGGRKSCICSVRDGGRSMSRSCNRSTAGRISSRIRKHPPP